jgi:hypothetical protein
LEGLYSSGVCYDTVAIRVGCYIGGDCERLIGCLSTAEDCLCGDPGVLKWTNQYVHSTTQSLCLILGVSILKQGKLLVSNKSNN